jgi:tetratricopeptide (TPR) repeat protein
MKFPLRIVVPISSALLVAGTVVGVTWWQLSSASIRLSGTQGNVSVDTGNIPANPSPATNDRVLLQLRQGDVAALDGEWAVAQKAYEDAVRIGGGMTALRKLAQAQMQRRDHNGALSTITKMEAQGAKEEDVTLLRSILLLRTGELVQAKALLDSAPESPHRQYGLALLSIIQSDHDAAKEHLQAVLNGWDPTLRTYGRALQSAYDEYAQFPKSPSVHLTTLLARALAETQECELALPLLNQVTTTQNDYRDAWMVQGYCEYVTERPQEALPSFEHAYNLDPEKPEIQYFLGRTYFALKDYDNSKKFLSYALQNGFKPEADVRQRLASVGLQTHDTSLTLEQYIALADLPDAVIGSYAQLITLRLSLEQKEEAYQDAQKAVQKWPDEAQAYDLLGWTAIETGRKQEAHIALEHALELDPDLQSAKDRLGDL